MLPRRIDIFEEQLRANPDVEIVISYAGVVTFAKPLKERLECESVGTRPANKRNEFELTRCFLDQGRSILLVDSPFLGQVHVGYTEIEALMQELDTLVDNSLYMYDNWNESLELGEWEPEGYSEPREWERSASLPAIVATVVTIPLFILSIGPTLEFANALIQWHGEILYSTFGLKGMVLTNISKLLILLIILLISGGVVALHEIMHFSVSNLVGFSPQFTWVEFAWVKNPAVINSGYRISARKQLPETVAPLFIIGIISVCGYFLFSGPVAGLFSWVLLINTSISSGDISLAIRLLRLPEGALFANIEYHRGFRTEITVPE